MFGFWEGFEFGSSFPGIDGKWIIDGVEETRSAAGVLTSGEFFIEELSGGEYVERGADENSVFVASERWKSGGKYVERGVDGDGVLNIDNKLNGWVWFATSERWKSVGNGDSGNGAP